MGSASALLFVELCELHKDSPSSSVYSVVVQELMAGHLSRGVEVTGRHTTVEVRCHYISVSQNLEAFSTLN